MLPWLLLLLLFLYTFYFVDFVVVVLYRLMCALWSLCLFNFSVICCCCFFHLYSTLFIVLSARLCLSLSLLHAPQLAHFQSVRLSSADSFRNLNECHTRFLKKWETEISYKNWIAYMRTINGHTSNNHSGFDTKRAICYILQRYGPARILIFGSFMIKMWRMCCHLFRFCCVAGGGAALFTYKVVSVSAFLLFC